MDKMKHLPLGSSIQGKNNLCVVMKVASKVGRERRQNLNSLIPFNGDIELHYTKSAVFLISFIISATLLSINNSIL
jgi:hypothetical protein